MVVLGLFQVAECFWCTAFLNTINCCPTSLRGFPDSTVGKECACNAGDWFFSWVGKTPWRRERLPTPVFWPGEFQGLTVHGFTESLTRLSDFHVTQLFQMCSGSKPTPSLCGWVFLSATAALALAWSYAVEQAGVKQALNSGQPREICFLYLALGASKYMHDLHKQSSFLTAFLVVLLLFKPGKGTPLLSVTTLDWSTQYAAPTTHSPESIAACVIPLFFSVPSKRCKSWSVHFSYLSI